MTKNILVTGGAGYIGSHTVVELVKAGYNPIIFDNYCNSSPLVIKRLEQLTAQKLNVYQGDIRSEDDLTKVFSSHNIDGVIHFAGLKAVGDLAKNHLSTTITTLMVPYACYGSCANSMSKLYF